MWAGYASSEYKNLRIASVSNYLKIQHHYHITLLHSLNIILINMDFLAPQRSTMGMDLRAAYAQSLVTEHLLKKYQVEHEDAKSLPVVNHVIGHPKTSGHGLAGLKGDNTEKICIIGAGAAGLATAMSLHKCEFYNIDILEASDQPGGRLYTYEFPDRGDGCRNNFCDIGAMRIPHIPRMDA